MRADLARGAAGEDVCRRLLESLGASVTVSRDKAEQQAGVDLWVAAPGLAPYSVQVKLDEMSQATGNCFVETSTQGGEHDGARSGLAACRADRVMYVLPGAGVLSCLPEDLLRSLPFLRSRSGVTGPANRKGALEWRACGDLVGVGRLETWAAGAGRAWWPWSLVAW